MSLAPPEPLGEAGPDLHYVLQGDDVYALMPWMNTKLQDLHRQKGNGECTWNISEQIQGTTGHNGANDKVCQRHCFDMDGVVQHTEDRVEHPSR